MPKRGDQSANLARRQANHHSALTPNCRLGPQGVRRHGGGNGRGDRAGDWEAGAAPSHRLGYAPSPSTSCRHLWSVAGHRPTGTLAEYDRADLEKIRALKALSVQNWALNLIALSKQQAYAAPVLMRRPSMTVSHRRQAVEVVWFLTATLIELADIVLLQASRRSQNCLQARRTDAGCSRCKPCRSRYSSLGYAPPTVCGRLVPKAHAAVTRYR